MRLWPAFLVIGVPISYDICLYIVDRFYDKPILWQALENIKQYYELFQWLEQQLHSC